MLQTYGNSYQYPPEFTQGSGTNNAYNTQGMVNSISGMALNSQGGSDEACTLFLGDLSVYCTEKDIRKLFRPFGVIEAIRVKRGSSNKTNLSYGFIKFSTKESAEQAMNQLNGVMFLGRTIRIGWAEGKSPTKVPKPKQEKKVETAQVHVSFISKQIDVLISEATIRGLFGLYGEVIDVALKKSQFDKNLKIQNGYGFVHFPLTEEGIKSAITAVNSLHQVTIDRVTYDCSVSHALEPFLQHSKEFGMESFSSNFSSLMQSSKNQQSPSLPSFQQQQHDDRMVDPLNLYHARKDNSFMHQQVPTHQFGVPSQFSSPSPMMNYSQPPPAAPYTPRLSMSNDMMMNGLSISAPSAYGRPANYAPQTMNDPLAYPSPAFMAPLPMPQPVPQNNYTYNNFYTQTPGGYATMVPKNQYL